MQYLSGQPNIVEIKGAYEDRQSVHLVMELCEGGELFDKISKRGHYSEKAAAEIIRCVVKVVDICHFMGVIHRDLKPENFLLSGKDEASAMLKATDFGVSVFIEEGMHNQHQQWSNHKWIKLIISCKARNYLYTFLQPKNCYTIFIFPRESVQRHCRKCILCCTRGSEEKLWQRNRYLERWSYSLHTSLWNSSILGRYSLTGSLGFVFLFLLFTVVFFSVETDKGIFEEILRGEIDFESKPWPSISEGAKDLVMNMLKSDPKSRYTAAQVLGKVTSILCLFLFDVWN